MRYLIFAGESYYPCGGMDDLYAEHDTLEEVEDTVKRIKLDRYTNWWHVYDCELHTMVVL